MYWELPAVFTWSFIISRAMRDRVLCEIEAAGFTRPNFRGKDIPLAAGVVFFLAALPAALPLFFLWPGAVRDRALLYLFAMAGATCLGLADDFWGNRTTTGLLGHLKALVRGRLTTGALKALGGGVLALIAGAYLYPGDVLRVLESAAIIALSINALNLFDLRPGRAGKVFILFYLLLLPFSLGGPEAVMATAVLGGLAAFMPVDLKARAMMGDAGANALGVVIGITAAACLDGFFRWGFLILLVLLHVVTEKYSLTSIIAGNPLLNYLDMLGREKGSE